MTASRSASGDEARARSSMIIDRAPEVVRAAFFDVDHHVRDKVHHGVTLRWAPPGAGDEAAPRRVRQEARVLGRAVTEEYVIEEDGGRWVKRFVGGPNAGGRYVATFATLAGEGTRVDAEANAPKAGFDNGLGKLSQLGVEKSLQKLLQEHKRALEGYEPGKVRGDVDRVITSLRDLTSPILERPRDEQRAVISNFLEAAALVSIADAEADDAERHTMKAIAKALCFVDLDDAAIERLVSGMCKAAEAEGIEARCDKIGQRLRRLSFQELGLAVAVLLAQVSHGIDARELAALQRIAHAGGVPESELATLVGRIDGMLSGIVIA